MTLAEKYRPASFKEVRGQDFAIESIVRFIKNFPSEKNAIILFGPAGTGKTTLAHVAARELGAELLEINSSDLRNREELEKIIKPASEQRSLFNKTKIILIDEVDGISKVDEGGLSALVEITKSTAFPIIMTANDIWDRKFAELRKNAEVIPVKQLDYRAVFSIIKEICIKENARISDEDILRVSIKADGDVRAAINDIEVLKQEADTAILSKNLLKRDEKKDIFAILKEVFKGKFSNELLGIFDKTDTPLDEIFLWIDENIPREYTGEELYNAYNALSLADLYRGRIIRRQHWRFLVYQSAFLSAGINLSKKKPKFGFTSYKRPERILKMWLLNQKNAKKKSIISKYADKNHISLRKASREFPYMTAVFKNPNIHKELGLSEEEVNYISSL
ncbi:replication factor C large subunit [Candidatus Pacearchaeota archaeon]|nr:replication factor C large subunit [Candidatus Pacearchaeota archaeon]